MTARPDAIRGSDAQSFVRALTPMTQMRVVPIDGSTVSHHAVITLAIRLSCSAVASRSHCQASSDGCSKLRCSIVSSFGHDRPSDARHLVGNGNGNKLGRLLGQQLHEWILPGVSHNRRCTDDEQPSEIAISLLGDAAEPLLAARRVLPRHKSNPCCKIPTGFEDTRVCNSGSDGRSPDHAYFRRGLEAAAYIIDTMMAMNGLIQSADLQFPGQQVDRQWPAAPVSSRTEELRGYSRPCMIAASRARPSRPVSATRPNSARWARSAAISCVR